MNKKILALFSCLLFVNILNAQQNKILYEMFSEPSCKFCPRANHLIDSLTKENPDKLISVKFETNFLNENDMNFQDSAEILWRYKKYYDVSNQGAVPRGIFDGKKYMYCIPDFFTQQILDSIWTMPKPFFINLSHSFKSDYDSVILKLKIKSNNTHNYQAGRLKARIFLTEDSIVFNEPPGTNGEKVFRNVLRKIIPDTGGIVLKNNWITNESDSMIIKFPVPKYIYNLNNISFIGLIQYDSSKIVLQTVKTSSVKLSDYAIIDKYTSLNFSNVICADTLKFLKVKVVNYGTNNLTSFDLKYQFDNDPPVLLHFNDNISQGMAKEFSLPDIPDTVGRHTYSVTLVNPNGHAYSNDFENVFTASANFIMKKQARLTPLLESFQGGFPPQDWLAINKSKTSQIWKKNFNPTIRPSVFLQIYENIFPGIVNELIMPIFDFSDLLECHLGFEVANAYGKALGPGPNYDTVYQYDTLMVLVSKDCGNQWDTVYNKNGPTLASMGHIDSYEIKPAYDEHWRLDTINLFAYVGYSKVLIKFVGISGNGNDIYLSNIDIGEHLGIGEKKTNEFAVVFPNPSSGVFNVLGKNLKYAEVYNAIGNKVAYINNIVSDSFVADLSDNPKGIYFIRIISENGVQTVKIILK